MKLKAITLVEIIIAMTILTALSVIALPALRQNSPDNEITKFRHVYGVMSNVIANMISDKAIYPDNYGFANTNTITMRNTGAQYGGPTKFKKVFKENFNVLEEDIEIQETKVPLYEVGPISGVGATSITVANKLECFTNNSGVTYCPPETPIFNGVQILKNLFIRVHINDKYEIDHAIYFKVASDGKIEFPYKIDNKFNCTLPEYNKYMQCRVISMLDEL